MKESTETVKNNSTAEPISERSKKKRKPPSPKELDILNFLMREKYLRAGFAATLNEILEGINSEIKKELRKQEFTEEEINKKITSKDWMYKLKDRLLEAGYIEEGVSLERNKTFYITPEGIQAYARCYETTQEDFTRITEALEPMRNNWSNELDKLMSITFPEEKE